MCLLMFIILIENNEHSCTSFMKYNVIIYFSRHSMKYLMFHVETFLYQHTKILTKQIEISTLDRLLA